MNPKLTLITHDCHTVGMDSIDYTLQMDKKTILHGLADMILIYEEGTRYKGSIFIRLTGDVWADLDSEVNLDHVDVWKNEVKDTKKTPRDGGVRYSLKARDLDKRV